MTFKPPAPAPEPEPRPGVEVGDHLYVHHGGQPCTGKVKAHGRHGVTVEIDGKHHPVKWDKVLGHKSRAPQKYKVIDDGEDGMLVEDAGGRRRFIAVPNESKEDPMVAKSIGQRSITLFLKSEAVDAAPVENPKKKAGAWAERGKKDSPVAPGEHIGFENGEHRGFGRVAAAGQHGVTVRDRAGGDHRVRHEQVTHQWSGDGEPDASPHKDTAGQDDALEQYDGKVPLPPELVAELLRQAAPELREKAAEFLMEKKAGAEIEEKAAGLPMSAGGADATDEARTAKS